jgi:hypothetical protein
MVYKANIESSCGHLTGFEIIQKKPQSYLRFGWEHFIEKSY